MPGTGSTLTLVNPSTTTLPLPSMLCKNGTILVALATWHAMTSPLTILPGLRVSFCPVPHSPISGIKDSLSIFQWDLYLKIYFTGQELPPAKLFVCSNWYPPLDAIPAKLQVRMRQFQACILCLFKQKTRCPPNLVPHQNSLLRTFQESQNILVVRTDKNLGPAIVDRTTYIHKVFTNHLSDQATYQSLSPLEADAAIWELSTKIFGFISEHHDDLPPAGQKFLLTSREEVKPHSQFEKSHPGSWDQLNPNPSYQTTQLASCWLPCGSTCHLCGHHPLPWLSATTNLRPITTSLMKWKQNPLPRDLIVNLRQRRIKAETLAQ